jgi:protein CpxP
MTQQHRANNSLVRFVTVASAALVLTFASGMSLAADDSKHEDRAAARVNTLHAKLKITPAQEDQWAKVAQVMREDGERMDTLTQARVDHAKSMTAIDDLKSYEEITQAHANGIKKLRDAFEPLYASMSSAQKAEADSLFRSGPGGRSAAARGDAKPAAK